MTTFYMTTAAMIAILLLVSLVRVVKGPTAADRMLSAQLFGTAGVAMLMLLGIAQQQAALLNAALVVAILAPITLITFVSLAGTKK